MNNSDSGEISVWGVELDDNYQRLEIDVVPCNYLHAEFGITDDRVDPFCEADH